MHPQGEDFYNTHSICALMGEFRVQFCVFRVQLYGLVYSSGCDEPGKENLGLDECEAAGDEKGQALVPSVWSFFLFSST